MIRVTGNYNPYSLSVSTLLAYQISWDTNLTLCLA